MIHTRPIVEQQEQSMTKERVKEVLQDSPPEGSLQVSNVPFCCECQVLGGSNLAGSLQLYM